MALESSTFISGLNSSNPTAIDPRSQGDDHIRLLKAVLQATFPNASSAFYFPTIIAAKVADYTVVLPDDTEKTIPVDASAANRTITMPSSGFFEGSGIRVVKNEFSLGTVTISGNGKTINGLSSITLTKGFQKAYIYYSTVLAAWLADIDTIVPTGTMLHNSSSSVSGYRLCDGASTIGDASSGADVSAVYTQALFQHLWDTYSNTICPVSGGRGASATADFAAHKRITMPDLRGRAIFGKDNMGGSAASRITNALSSIAGDTVGSTGGSQTKTLSEAELPVVNRTPAGTIAVTVNNGTSINQGGSNSLVDISGATSPISKLGSTSTVTITATASFTGTQITFGSGTAFTPMPPAFISNIHIAF